MAARVDHPVRARRNVASRSRSGRAHHPAVASARFARLPCLVMPHGAAPTVLDACAPWPRSRNVTLSAAESKRTSTVLVRSRATADRRIGAGFIAAARVARRLHYLPATKRPHLPLVPVQSRSVAPPPIRRCLVSCIEQAACPFAEVSTTGLMRPIEDT